MGSKRGREARSKSTSHSISDVPVNPSAQDLFAGAGEMAALMRATDWSKTRLGPVENWPQSLRTMLGVILGSRFPMLLWWGPELLHLYNDAYRPILRDKHPASLGAPAAEIWAEVWDVAGPMAKSVQEGGPATWTEDLQLFINSGGMAEETYFTFSYSPVPGDDGGIGGLLNTVQETTEKVQSERQIRMLHDLAARTAQAKSEDEAHRMVMEVLTTNALDIPFALLYVLNEKADIAQRVAMCGWRDYEGRANSAQIAIHGEAGTHSWPIADVIRTGSEVVVDDLATRFGALPAGRWNMRPERAIVLPLFRSGQAQPYALLIAAISSHRAFDERYQRFFRATADQISSVIANARAYESEKNRAEALTEVDRAKTAFFSNVSHEFRTPLTLILGPIEAALAQSTKTLHGDDLATVHRSALRLLRLVNSLLDFARIEAGRLQLSFVSTDLSTLTTDLASSFRSLLERAGLKLTVDCPAISAPVYVDPSQWEKIVLNLLSNAFKFTFTGEIVVRLRSHGDHVELQVRDTGSGIPSNELPRIFERFQRVEGTKGRSFEGTGIGLSLVQELVKLHGGSVSVTSVEGEGSTFTVSLPTGSAHLPAECIVDRSAPSMPTSAAPYLLEAGRWIGADHECVDAPSAPLLDLPVSVATPMPSAREPARVLVADDNADMRTYLSRLLSTRWQVEVVEDGQSALDSACHQPPDLVLSDVMMPRLNGFELLRALRTQEQTKHIPVVLLSARAGEDVILEGLEIGADDYLVKPFSARELLVRVHTHLELARLRREWSGELERANKELEAFCYSVSHDLRAPLRAIDGFSNALLSDCSGQLDQQGRHYLERVCAGTQRMGELIDDLLNLSRITRAALRREHVDITGMARMILSELGGREPERKVEAQVADKLVTQADSQLLRVLLENLLGNAWKFTSKSPTAKIEVGQINNGNEAVYFVSDNGAGFDMEYAKKLFAPFQRLHSAAEFEGTGIGLATVHRVVSRHGGRVWVDAAIGHGAKFFFTLGEPQ